MKDNNIEQNNIYNLKQRKEQAKSLIQKYLSSEDKNDNILEEVMKLDNTIPELYFYKLKNSDEIKLRQKSYDILNKDLLAKFNIKKNINYKDLYFEILDYIESITLDEPDNAEENFELEEFIGTENEESEEGEESEEDENPENDKKSKNIKNEIKEEKTETEKEMEINKCKNDNNIIIDVDIESKNDLDENLSDSEFKKVLEKKEGLDITNLLNKNEKIKVVDIKKKFNYIYEACCTFSNFKNNYPDFESELFYFNCIRYMLETFKELKYKRFIKKVVLTDYISEFTHKMKEGKIQDNLIKIFYYYIMNTQYDFDEKYLKLLIYEAKRENTNIIKNNDFFVKNNILYSKKDKSEIILENVDDYLINEIIEDNILFKKNKNKLIKKYYSIKGLLKHSSFSKENGDKFLEEFLNSNILTDIVKRLYDKDNMFNQKVIIDLFKEHSYYFPNSNNSFIALSHKELFNMYFPPSNINPPTEKVNNSFSLKMINRAFDKIKIQHEWGYTSSYFLFFTLKIKYFETPKRKVKIKKTSDIKKKEKNITEGGKAVEILLYGRVIKELNAKEAIFILNSENYNLSLTEFHHNFNTLKNYKLSDIFKEAMKNPNIDVSVKEAFNEYNQKGKYFKHNMEHYSFRIKEKKNSIIDLDNIKFERGKNIHPKNSCFIKNKLNI